MIHVIRINFSKFSGVGDVEGKSRRSLMLKRDKYFGKVAFRHAREFWRVSSYRDPWQMVYMPRNLCYLEH